VLRDFTPLVERISIDEAFLDVTGSVHLFGAPAEIAPEIRRRVRVELGLPVSVGVATTKHLAKVASQVAKPDGVVVVEAGMEQAFLQPGRPAPRRADEGSSDGSRVYVVAFRPGGRTSPSTRGHSGPSHGHAGSRRHGAARTTPLGRRRLALG